MFKSITLKLAEECSRSLSNPQTPYSLLLEIYNRPNVRYELQICLHHQLALQNKLTSTLYHLHADNRCNSVAFETV